MVKQSWDSQMIDGVFPTKVKDVKMSFIKDQGYFKHENGSLYETDAYNRAIEDAATCVKNNNKLLIKILQLKRNVGKEEK